VPSLDWESEVRPTLVAVYQAWKNSSDASPVITSAEINRELGREADDPRHDFALDYLNKTGFISGTRLAAGNDVHWSLVTLERDGLVEVAGWPATPGADYASKLIDVLNERIEATDDDEVRSRYQRLKDAATSMGKEILTAVLSDLARRPI
jgi:hypothetical protein